MNGFENVAEMEATAAGRTLPVLALRQRSADHPMAMFALIVGSAFVSMAMASSSGMAASATERAPVRMVQELPTSGKSARLVQLGDAARLCEGQAWGGETTECLLAIARESGETREIRLLASAQPLATTPNVF